MPYFMKRKKGVNLGEDDMSGVIMSIQTDNTNERTEMDNYCNRKWLRPIPAFSELNLESSDQEKLDAMNEFLEGFAEWKDKEEERKKQEEAELEQFTAQVHAMGPKMGVMFDAFMKTPYGGFLTDKFNRPMVLQYLQVLKFVEGEMEKNIGASIDAKLSELQIKKN